MGVSWEDNGLPMTLHSDRGFSIVGSQGMSVSTTGLAHSHLVTPIRTHTSVLWIWEGKSTSESAGPAYL